MYQYEGILSVTLRTEGKLEEALFYAKDSEKGNISTLGAEHPKTKTSIQFRQLIEKELGPVKNDDLPTHETLPGPRIGA